MLESLPNASHRMLVRAQHYFFFPILLFARLSWCQQSVAHAYSLSKVQLPLITQGMPACHQFDSAIFFVNRYFCCVCMQHVTASKTVVQQDAASTSNECNKQDSTRVCYMSMRIATNKSLVPASLVLTPPLCAESEAWMG